jgi:hypothetical protein
MGRRLDFQIVHFEIHAAMTLQNVRVGKVWLRVRVRVGFGFG